MEGVQKMIGSIPKGIKSGPSPSSVEAFRNGGDGVASILSSPEQSRLLLTRPSRHIVSMWTCSKLCAVCFFAGVVVGYSLKRRVKRWASKLLKRLKDD